MYVPKHLLVPTGSPPRSGFVQSRRQAETAKEEAQKTALAAEERALKGDNLARLLAAADVSGDNLAGITMNGGGVHAVSGAYGILRGLAKHDKALDRLDVIAGVSGGMWTVPS